MSTDTTTGLPPAPESDIDTFYIRTPSSLADDRNLVLKEGDTFVVVDRYGDIRPVGMGEEGLYHRGTRFLAELSLRVGDRRALLLSSAVKSDNAQIAVDLTNPDMDVNGGLLARGTLHVSRTIVLWDGVLHERLLVRNYGSVPIAMPLTLVFGADYADIFEVRGSVRPARGEPLQPVVDESGVVLSYRGLDGVTRRTRMQVRPGPSRVTPRLVRIDLVLMPHGEETYDILFACEQGENRPRRVTFGEALKASSETLASRRKDVCSIETSNAQFNAWVRRSIADLSMMVTRTEFGPYPYAGVPWFSVPFGRDGIITALECLWAAPALARGVLSYLAATQATTTDSISDSQPGKILHEAREGEMAATGEIPFARYYGSHDATPLFVMLAAAYYERSGDRTTIERIWPNIEAALEWIDRSGDLDGDGFVEYLRQSPTGLVHQGWKDSHDSVFHRDSRPAEGPIALCEIQGYVYAAWKGASMLARMLDRAALADELDARAGRLKEQFDRVFWCDAIGTYALALDGEKQRCEIVASNAGHALFSGIATEQRARDVARALMSKASFSGWGVRTVATSEGRYNPMSYHNGSIWPHDNAIIAAGLARYDFRAEAQLIMQGMFEASLAMDLHRLPELFCGFPRRNGEVPTEYPVACSPQSWAAGAVFLLLQALLGLEIDAAAGVVRFTRSRLPPFLDEVRLSNLRVGQACLDLVLERHPNDVTINVIRRDGDVEVIAIK